MARRARAGSPALLAAWTRSRPVAALELGGERRERVKLGRHERQVPVGGGEVGHGPGELEPGRPACDGGRRRRAPPRRRACPSRPMPLSSLTCTSTARAHPRPRAAAASASTKRSSQATTSAPAPSATGSSSALTAPSTSSGRGQPGGTQLRRLARGRHRQHRGPARQRRPRHGDGAVAGGIGLDHRAQLGAGVQAAAQRDHVALDRGQVDPGQRTQCHGQILSEPAAGRCPLTRPRRPGPAAAARSRRAAITPSVPIGPRGQPARPSVHEHAGAGGVERVHAACSDRPRSRRRARRRCRPWPAPARRRGSPRRGRPAPRRSCRRP